MNKPSTLLNSTTQDMHGRILTVAKTLFRQKGYASVSISDIVIAVGVTKPTLYHYFSDKETLYTEILVAMMQNASMYIQEGIDPCQTLRQNLYTLTHGFLLNSPTSMTAMIRDALELLSEVNQIKIRQAYKATILTPFEVMFTTAAMEGEIDNYPEQDLALMYISLLDAFLVGKRASVGRHFDYEMTARTIVEVFLSGAMHRDSLKAGIQHG